MARAFYLTFHGSFRGTHEQEHHLHESPWSMLGPLWILAAGAVVAGWVGIPKLLSFGRDINWFHHFLEPVMERIPQGAEAGEHGLGIGLELALVVLTTLVAAGSLWYGRSIYRPADALAREQAWADRFPTIHRLLVNKYYVDEIYDRLIVRPLAALSRFFREKVDGLLIDGTIHVGAWLTELTGEVGRLSTTGNVRNYALYFFLGVIALFAWLVF
jgi:NADH-quinone oxidoreductase subunit L